MRKKSILILSATAGAGHVRAAEALEASAKISFPSVAVRHEDILTYTFPLFKKAYSQGYFAIVNKSPELWGYLYKRSEFKGPSKNKSPLMKVFDHFNYKKYIKTLHDLKPDAVLCTHFLPYLSIADEIKKPSWRIPFFAAVTDYDAHSLWINSSVTRFYVATEETRWTLQSHNIAHDNIAVTGIPVMPEFGKHVSKRSARVKMELSSTAFTIMILSGGYGVGVIDELVPSVIEFVSRLKHKEFQILVVCGKNRRLFETLNRLSFPKNVHVKLFQYVSFVDTLMDCADLLITKSGGLTVSEALAKNLPMIIFDPIPGQEARNADYITEHGAAIRAINLINLNFKIQQLIEQPVLLMKMRSNAKTIAKPLAAEKILKDIIQQI